MPTSKAEDFEWLAARLRETSVVDLPQIGPETEIYRDLNIYGDDLDELLADVARRCGVSDFSGELRGRYAPDEVNFRDLAPPDLRLRYPSLSVGKLVAVMQRLRARGSAVSIPTPPPWEERPSPTPRMGLLLVAALLGPAAAALAGLKLGWPAWIIEHLVALSFLLMGPVIANNLTQGRAQAWFNRQRRRALWAAVYVAGMLALFSNSLGWPPLLAVALGAVAIAGAAGLVLALLRVGARKAG